MNNNLTRFLPSNVETRVTYTGQKYGTKFQFKNTKKYQHKQCPEQTCSKNCLGETRKRIIERLADH